MPATGKRKKKNAGESIQHEVLIRAQAKKVFQAIATTQGVAGWWTADCYVPDGEGETAHFNFGEKYRNTMTVSKRVINRVEEWTCIEADPEWMGTKIRFTLQPDGMQTRVVFEHEDWKEKTVFFGSCTLQWEKYLNSLKSFCETGSGNPFKE